MFRWGSLNNGEKINHTKTSVTGWPKKIIIGLAGCALIYGYGRIFSTFFPVARGGLGHDFALGLPQLLSG